MTNEPKAELKEESKPEASAVPQPEIKVEPKPTAEGGPQSDLTPQIVKRVHEFYEELGRENVRAVEGLEKTKWETRIDEARAEPKSEAQAQQKPKSELKKESDPALFRNSKQVYVVAPENTCWSPK